MTHELLGMKQVLKQAIEAKIWIFQVDFEKVIEELERVKVKSAAFEKEMETSKAQKFSQKYNNVQKKPEANIITILKSNKSDKVFESRNS